MGIRIRGGMRGGDTTNAAWSSSESFVSARFERVATEERGVRGVRGGAKDMRLLVVDRRIFAVVVFVGPVGSW